MMKQIIFLIGAMFAIAAASAQSDYLVHTIKDGETLTQLAGRYNTTVGDIMRLNQMNTDSKLSVGQEVKIPTSGDSSVATHVVGEKETLYSIAKRNNVTVEQLESWNNLPDDIIHEGQVLKLGSTGVSAAIVAAADNSAQSADTNASVAPQTNSDAKTWAATPAPPRNADGGLFGPTYQNTGSGTEIITKGTAGIFKSSSGWQDKKYYILMNDVPPGTVVKVQANGKTIFAKTLWSLGNVKENAGLSYRISDAAASKLNANGDSFDIIVSYFKS